MRTTSCVNFYTCCFRVTNCRKFNSTVHDPRRRLQHSIPLRLNQTTTGAVLRMRVPHGLTILSHYSVLTSARRGALDGVPPDRRRAAYWPMPVTKTLAGQPFIDSCKELIIAVGLSGEVRHQLQWQLEYRSQAGTHAVAILTRAGLRDWYHPFTPEAHGRPRSAVRSQLRNPSIVIGVMAANTRPEAWCPLI